MGEKGRKKSLQNAAIIAMMVKVQYRGVAQLGSALLWGSRGRGFESRRSDCRKTEQGRDAPNPYFVLFTRNFLNLSAFLIKLVHH